MSSTTPVSALRYAVQTDAASAQTGFQNLATDLDRILCPVYATTTARDAAIPAPTQGMLCYITATAAGANNRTLQYYTGSAWQAMYRSPTVAYKTAAETVTSSTTYQADDHMTVAVEANTTYEITLYVSVVGNSDNVADLKMRFTYPTSAQVACGMIGPPTNTTNASDTNVNTTASITFDSASPSPENFFGTDDISASIFCHGILIVGATAGNLAVEWAQNSSSANATSLNPGCYLKIQRIA